MKEDLKNARMLYETILEAIEHADMSREAVIAVLTKVLVLTCIPDESKRELLERVAYVYDFENFYRPESTEIN